MKRPVSKVRVATAVLATAAAVAFATEVVHTFVHFGARAKAAEARTNLKRLCLAQAALLAELRPATTFRGLRAEVERSNRYAYFVAPGPVLEERDTDHGPSTPNPLATGLQVDVRRFGPSSIEKPVTEAALPAEFLGGLRLGANGACPACVWMLVAAGSIDFDGDLDVWSAATVARTSEGHVVGPCEPFHERDDIEPGPVRRLLRRR